jgi:hypothetical protein
MIRSGRRHLEDVGEGYFEHSRAALSISASLARASLACAIHAVIPGLCTHTASRSIADLHSRISRRPASSAAARREAPPGAQAHDGREDFRFRIDV